jgi:hypothetical protein
MMLIRATVGSPLSRRHPVATFEDHVPLLAGTAQRE